MIGRVVEFFVECAPDFFSEFGKVFGIVSFIEQRGDARHDFRILKIKRRGRECDGGKLRDAGRLRTHVAPVTEAVIDDVVARTAAEIGEMVSHRVVMHAEQVQVAVEFILLPRHEDEGATPFRRIAKHPAQMIRVPSVAENRVFRRSRRHEAVREL